MEYRNKIISKLTQLENYARTCFVAHMGLPNGQGQAVNEFIDRFMEDLTNCEMFVGKDCKFYNEFTLSSDSDKIGLDTCLDWLLPDCYVADGAEDSYLYTLVGEWIHDNLLKCVDCGEWYLASDDLKYGRCEACQDNADANDPDTIADYLNDLDRCE